MKKRVSETVNGNFTDMIIRHTYFAALMALCLLFIGSNSAVSKPAGTVPGDISLSFYKSGTGTQESGMNDIYASLGDTISIDVLIRNFSQVPVSAIEVYLTIDNQYFDLVSQGINTEKNKYEGQIRPFIQGVYLKNANGSVQPYGNNTFGDMTGPMDNFLSGWQLDYAEVTGPDVGFGRPVSKLLYGVVCTFKLVAKAPCDSIPIKLDMDAYNMRVSQYYFPNSNDSYSFQYPVPTYISVSGITIFPPIPDIAMAPGSKDSTLVLNDHVGLSSIPDSLLVWTVKGNQHIGVDVNPRTTGVTLTAPSDFRGAEDIIFTVSYGSKISASDTMRVMVDNPPKLILSALPDTLRVLEDSLQSVLYLPKIVQDNDDSYSALRWFFKAINGKLKASTVSDSLCLKGVLNFNGNENLRISVYDSFGVGDSLTVPVWVIPVNDPPVLKELPAVTLERNTSYALNMDEYASDVDLDQLAVSWNTSSHLLLQKSGMQVTISGAPGFLGSEAIYFTVTDPGGLSASDSMQVTLTPAKKAPVWSKIPKIGFPQNHADSSLALWNYIADPDDADSLLTFVFANTDNVDSVYVNPHTGRTTFYDRDDSPGWDRVTVTAFDPDGNSATTRFSAFIGPADGTPIVAGIPDTTIVAGGQADWIDLDDYYYDVDNTDSQMKWTWGRQANADSSASVYISPSTHMVILRGLSAEKYGINRIFFTVTDPDGKFGDDICIISTIMLNRPTLDLPDKVGFVAGTTYTIDLDDYVYDGTYSKDELTWSWSGNRNSIISLETSGDTGKAIVSSDRFGQNGKIAKIAASRPLSFTGPSTWIGWERVAFKVKNPLGGAAADTLRVYSVNSDGTPVVGGLDRVTLKAGQSIEVGLDSYYYDADNADFQMTWTASGSDSVTVSINPLSHIATISAPSMSWEGQNTITFTITDPSGLSASMQTVVVVTDAILDKIFAVSIFRNPMQEDYMDLFVKSSMNMLSAPTVVARTQDDSTKVTVTYLDSLYYYGRYLLPLGLSIGVKGTAEIFVTGKNSAGKNISGSRSFGYGRLNSTGGKIVCGKLSLDVPSGALSKPEFITLVPGEEDKESPKAVMSEITFYGESCLLGPASLKPEKNLVLGIDTKDCRGAGIYRMTGGSPVFVGGEFRNGVIAASVSCGGSFRLGYDLTPPRIQLRDTDARTITIALSDGGSGIDEASIHVTLDGSSTPWRYDETRSLVTVDLSGEAITGSLDITVSDRSGNAARESVSLSGAVHPHLFAVEQNSPNPFNPKTDIGFTLPDAGMVTIEVFDHIGRKIAVLAHGGFSAGRHTVVWDAHDDQGREVSSGVYIYRVTSGGRTVSRKMLFLR